MKVALSAAMIALAALAVTACGASASSGNGSGSSGAGGNGFGGSAAIASWEASNGGIAAPKLEDYAAPAALSDAAEDATTQFQIDASNIEIDVAKMVASPPPEDTTDWNKAIASYSAAVSDLNSGNSSAAVSDLNVGSTSISAFGNAVGDPDLEA